MALEIVPFSPTTSIGRVTTLANRELATKSHKRIKIIVCLLCLFVANSLSVSSICCSLASAQRISLLAWKLSIDLEDLEIPWHLGGIDESYGTGQRRQKADRHII